MAYSADLRNKALNFYEQCKNISQTAATFNLSRNTLYLWIKLRASYKNGDGSKNFICYSS